MNSKHPAQLSRILPPSAEVREEALSRARRIAQGLFPHQVEGVAFLLARRKAILADDMGLGKTRQAIVAMVEATPQGPWLVVCPASVKQNWAREIWLAHADAEVCVVGPAPAPGAEFRGWVVVNYDILANVKDQLLQLSLQGLVFDEAHYLKNHTSKRSKLARELVAERPDAVVHCLTGTPLTNRPRDLFPLLQLTGHPMGRSFLSFAKRYCNASHNGYGWVTDGASNLEDLRTDLHGVMLRRTKDQVLDLPPKLRTWLPIDVPEGTALQQTRRVFELLLAARGGPAASNGAGRPLAKGRDRIQLLAALTNARLAISKAKIQGTKEFVEGVVDQGEKVLVFTSFDEPAKKLAAAFGAQAVLLTGATPVAKRQALVDRFQSDPSVQVFVANLVAGGTGLNLTAASQVVFHDLDWVPANHWQAEDRAYRIGQTRSVSVTYLVAARTVDEFVRTTLETKSALVESVVGDAAQAALDRDLFAQLEKLLEGLSPGIATLGDEESGEEPVSRILRELVAAARTEAPTGSVATGSGALAGLSEEAILALARVLSGPTARRFKAASSSRPGQSYLLEQSGADFTCTCPGFEYRGACSHARSLKAALAAKRELPAGITPE